MELGAFSLTAVGLLALASAAPSGEQLYRQRCQACHQVGRPSPLGPNLAGVVGRKAGTSAFNYSAAMKRSGLTWTPAILERYLAGPARMVPGTRMVVSVPVPSQRRALIEHLTKMR